MKVLLHVDVPKLGYLGDVVTVKDGFARNYLLPQGLAVEPNEGNIKAIADERARQAEVRRLARDEMVKACAKVDGASVRIEALINERGHLFGSVSEEGVAVALREAGYEVATRQIVMPEHFRMVGSYEVEVRYADDIRALVTVKVAAEGSVEESEETAEQTETSEQAEMTDDTGAESEQE